MHYYLIKSHIIHGECEYEHQYIIASESYAPDDADDRITVWNWGGGYSWSYDRYDLGDRGVFDSIEVKIHESEIPLLKKYIPIISVDLATLQPMEDE
jgi:hypothetical protein